MKFFSQYQQDKFLYENFFKEVSNGFFVDIGASEPDIQNNTFFFEKIGWNGILVEPRPFIAEKLKKVRKNTVVNAAIHSTPNKLKFLSCSGYIEGLSGLICEMTQQHLSRIFSELIMHGDSVSVINVKTITFDSLMEEYGKGIEQIDYLSIDTEGAEAAILKSINFSKYLIKNISIENNYKNEEIYKILNLNGFEKIAELGCDEIYHNIKR